MSRKTISVETIKSMVDGMLLNSEDDYQQGRSALANFLEKVLMDTGNYKGFSYLSGTDMTKSEYGTTVGIFEMKEFGEKFENTDHTRVRYF